MGAQEGGGGADEGRGEVRRGGWRGVTEGEARREGVGPGGRAGRGRTALPALQDTGGDPM